MRYKPFQDETCIMVEHRWVYGTSSHAVFVTEFERPPRAGQKVTIQLQPGGARLYPGTPALPSHHRGVKLFSTVPACRETTSRIAPQLLSIKLKLELDLARFTNELQTLPSLVKPQQARGLSNPSGCFDCPSVCLSGLKMS